MHYTFSTATEIQSVAKCSSVGLLLDFCSLTQKFVSPRKLERTEGLLDEEVTLMRVE